MIQTFQQSRRAGQQDRHQISNLLMYEANTHRHLDWRSPLDWIAEPNFWVLNHKDGRLAAAFACPEDPPGVGWIRLFSHSPHLSSADAWRALWDIACADILSSHQKPQIAAIVSKHWFQKLLISSGFELSQNIILLDLHPENIKDLPRSNRILLREMRESDLSAVAEVDLDAFGPFWHNSRDTLARARLQASHALVAENETGALCGYLVGTGGALGVHLARLAVRKDAQGLGIGSSLLMNLIQKAGGRQMGKISVNTQADNKASIALYEKAGFVRTGEFFPVFTYSFGGRYE